MRYLLLSLLLMSFAAAAQEYPSRPVTVIVPFSAGGPTDQVARQLAARFAEKLGQPFVVENVTGGNTIIATGRLARAPADGYTLLVHNLQISANPGLYGAKLPYDTERDIAPVGFINHCPLVLVGRSALPPKDLAELIQYMRMRSINIAHAGAGTTGYITTALFLQQAKLDALLVPYRGAAPAIGDIVAGHVGLLFTAPSTSIALGRDGKVRILGVTGHQRMKSMPEVPTLRESGVDMGGLDANQWFGVAAPAGTPDYVVTRINAAVNKVLKDKALQEKIGKLEFTVAGGTPEEAAALRAELAQPGDRVLIKGSAGLERVLGDTR